MFGREVIMYCYACHDKCEQAFESDACECECPCCGEMAWGSAEEYLMDGYVD
jgi:hypothetical protein